MTSDTLHGFPPGYFVIRATNSYHRHSDRHMQLDIAHSERRPGVELVLRTDNTHSPSLRQHLKHALNHWHGDDPDSQVFFMSEDGVLRSESSGHPVGCEIDEGNGTAKLVVQPPQPFDNFAQPPRYYQFEYDEESSTIAARLVHDMYASPQLPKGPYAAQSSETVNSSDSGPCISITSEGSTLADTDQTYLLEFVPKRHRHSSFSQIFDRLLESPTEGSGSGLRVPSNAALNHSNDQDKEQNNSWNENRVVQLVQVRERKRRAATNQKWEIVPVKRISCEVASKAWSVAENKSV